MIRVALLIAIVCSVTTISASPAYTGCAWAGRIYSDGELKVNGQICQICQAGKWVDRDANCQDCKPKNKPVESNPEPMPYDCTAQVNPASPQRLTFTDGARLSQAEGKFQKCEAGQWTEKKPPPPPLCSEH